MIYSVSFQQIFLFFTIFNNFFDNQTIEFKWLRIPLNNGLFK